MKEYESFEEVAKSFFNPNQFGFDDWVVIKISDLEKEKVVLLTLANPIFNEIKQIVVKNYTKEELKYFKQSYVKHYLTQLHDRFGFFIPDRKTGDVEYEDYNLFKQYWIEHEGKNIIPFNIPLLFDFPSDLEYSEAKQEKNIAVNYQRCIAVIAQPRKKLIKTLFIKNVTEEIFNQIQIDVLTQTNKVKDELYA